MKVESVTTGAWSDPVGGIRGRLLAGRGGVLAETPEARVDLELQNVADIGNPLWLCWDVDRVLSFVLRDELGKDIEKPSLPCNIVRVSPYWLALPYDSTLRMNITTTGYGRRANQALFIGLPAFGVWEIAPGDRRRFFLRGTLSVMKAEEPNPRAWNGILDLPAVEVIVPGHEPQDEAAPRGAS